MTSLLNGGIWIPAQDSPGNWLLIGLHGSGGAAGDFSGLEEIWNIPEMNYLYLNGLIRQYSGFRWYSDLAPRDSCYDFIHRILQQAEHQGFPPEHTFLMGFSQGASLAIEAGARYPKLLAGYIGISGRIENLPGLLSQGNPAVIRNGRWLITHGTQDYNLSIDIIRGQVAQMRDAGFSVDFREYDKIHAFDAKKELPDLQDWVLAIKHRSLG